mmetsp:Transcript_442/g.1479  ORF Transcript_442/g.1479 Transcript_442/m.1479 type:complete len:403 (-) Transcript_442:78-1286(-)
MLISMSNAAIVFLGLSTLTQIACDVTHCLQGERILSCHAGDHVSFLQVQANRAAQELKGSPEGDPRKQLKHTDERPSKRPRVAELMARSAGDDYHEDSAAKAHVIEDYDEADEDEDLPGRELAMTSDLEYVVDKHGGNLSFMSWPWSWSGMGFSGPSEKPQVKIGPTSLMENPFSSNEVSDCDRKMASIVGGMPGHSTVPKAHSKNESWAISTTMFEFLGRVAKNALSGPDKVVCETGFRYGTSAMAFLCLGNATQVRAYSRRQNEYVQAASQLIDKEYPGQLTFVSGDSKQTVRDSLGVDGWKSCDVAFVAGGRRQKVAKEDIANFAKWAKPGSLLMVDGCGKGKGPRLAFDKAAAEGIVMNSSYFINFKGFKKTICLGHYSGKEATMVQAYLEASGSKGD